MNKWFSVEKTNPVTSGWYLVYLSNSTFLCDRIAMPYHRTQLTTAYHKTGVGWSNPEINKHVTHWTHLPDKPNEDNVDNE